MRIAQIAPPWIAIPPQHYGGTENVIYHLVEELVALGHDVTLFAPGDAHTSAQQIAFIPHSLIAEGVPWQANLKAYYHLHKALQYVAAHDFDIVHTHLSSSADMYLFPLSASLTTPHVTTLHSHFPFDHGPDNWIGDADQHFMEWAEHISLVAISKSARAHQHVPINFVGVVHHGIRVQEYQPDNTEQDDYFVWMGRMTRAKGLHLAIEAALKAGVPLRIAGIKDGQKGEELAYYHHMIEPYIDGQHIRLVGPQTMQQKIALFSRARSLLNPIEWEEPFGMVMIEAMATGCPVIAFARGAAPEIITHGENGFLARSVDDMVDCIARIDEIDRGTVRQYVEHHFSARTMAENYLRVYQRVIDASPSGRITEPLVAGIFQP